jgi:hypothetical protein
VTSVAAGAAWASATAAAAAAAAAASSSSSSGGGEPEEPLLALLLDPLRDAEVTAAVGKAWSTLLGESQEANSAAAAAAAAGGAAAAGSSSGSSAALRLTIQSTESWTVLVSGLSALAAGREGSSGFSSASASGKGGALAVEEADEDAEVGVAARMGVGALAVVGGGDADDVRALLKGDCDREEERGTVGGCWGIIPLTLELIPEEPS